MTRTSRTTRLVVLTLVLLGAAVWLLLGDVSVDEGRHYAGSSEEAGPTFCGSAYDVALLKGNGSMGGEVPADQRLIDSRCVAEAGRAVSAGSALAGAGLVTGILAATAVVRERRRPGTESGRHPRTAVS